SGHLSRRRGTDQGQAPRATALAVPAFGPQRAMFRYATDLRSSTQGRATYTMQFERYEEVPANIAEEISSARSGEKAGAEA
ncbi:MAG: elongation factor G, partial [Solirubrobacterales bacterium]